MNKKGSLGDWIGVIFVLAVILGFMSYSFWIKPLKANVGEIVNDTLTNISDMVVVHDFPYFNHKPITYYYNDKNEDNIVCDFYEKKRIVETFDKLQNISAGLTFEETEGYGDIEINCYGAKSLKNGYFLRGEGGGYNDSNNVITKGILNFYEGLDCAKGDLEIHEMLHVLGFSHNDNVKSIMYGKFLGCGRTIDAEIINKLKEIYG